jgi:hypothetical protein
MPLVSEPLSPTTVELLAWVARRPRTYSEAIDAWRSNCPRLSAWDDALTGGLLRVSRGADGAGGAEVTVTARGSAMLAARDAAASDGHQR